MVGAARTWCRLRTGLAKILNLPKAYSSTSSDGVNWSYMANLPSRSIRASFLYQQLQTKHKVDQPSCDFLVEELQRRFCKLIIRHQRLPPLVHENRKITSLVVNYKKAVEMLQNEYSKINNERKHLQSGLTDLLTRVSVTQEESIFTLAEGISEINHLTRNHSDLQQFCDEAVHTRLGTHLLTQYWLEALREAEVASGASIIPICTLDNIVHSCESIVSTMCHDKYGVTPRFHITGTSGITFPYFRQTLKYILREILKNSFRATSEHFIKNGLHCVGDVCVHVEATDRDFVLRVTDQGGGVTSEVIPEIWKYGYSGETTTVPVSDSAPTFQPGGLFGEVISPSNRTGEIPSKMHGYGFGLPVCRRYARSLGGDLELRNNEGVGMETILTLQFLHKDGSTVFI